MFVIYLSLILIAIHSIRPISAQLNREKFEQSRHDARNAQPSLTDNLKLKVRAHYPCNKRANQAERIRFPSSSDAPLVEDQNSPGCYVLRGPIEVLMPISADMQMYVEVRPKAARGNPARPIPCRKSPGANQTAFGSCVFEQRCAQIESEFKARAQTLQVRLTKGGRELECGESVSTGTHDDIQLHFCMLPKREFLSIQGYDNDGDSDIFNELVDLAGGTLVNEQSLIFMRLYVFDYDVQRIYNTQQKIENIQRANLRLGPKEALPQHVFDRLPFNRFIRLTDNYVACHVMLGNVILD